MGSLELNNCTVSVVCLTYNHAPFIAQCIDSILMQECQFDFEILIHDDCSTDGTTAIILDYQKRFPGIIKPYIQKDNQYSQGNYGLNIRYNFSRSRAPYIAMCDGDDYWTDPHKLQKQFEYLEANKDYVICSHLRMIVDSQGNELKNTNISTRGFSPPCILFRNVFKSDIFTADIKVFNEDLFILYYIQCFGKSHILDFVGCAYRQSELGLWSTLQEIEKSNVLRDSLLKMKSFFKTYGYNTQHEMISSKLIENEIRFLKNSKGIKHFPKLFCFSFQAIRLKRYSYVKQLIKAFFGF